MKFIKKVRENLKDPKKKSATLLSMYVVFFIFVFALISSNNYSTSEEPIINKTLNYEYEVKINLLSVNSSTHNDLFGELKKKLNKDNILIIDSDSLENERLFNTEIPSLVVIVFVPFV